MRTIIKVTEKDIKYGLKGNSNNCAIARVVKRMIKKEYRYGVRIGTRYMSIIERCGTTENIETPKKASKFIKEFDTQPKSQTKPICFTVNIPEEYLIKSK